ncbi:sulfite oxidase [Halocatena salina]|uniref:Sulfite oxidase n=1 Tax=Halocatena salina TaxID=2934340 RepID=A0A8U0A3J8_9EURY|nr:sulfite oxidase [Halocatena salina]UPM43426.1 sulfite oxidase [Halocatena salina]
MPPTRGSTSDEESTDTENETPAPYERYLNRRQYLAVGLTAGVSAFAGCSQLTGTGDERTPTATRTEPGVEERPGYHTYSTSELEEKYPALRIFSNQPPNAETESRDQYTEFTTSVDATYIRSHYDSPKLTEADHTISLEGLIEESTELSMDALKSEFSTVEVAHTMQCAGNGRSYLDPNVAGTQWTFGAMGTAIYAGTPVGEVLEQHGAQTDDELYLAVMGADAPEGKKVFARSIPMSKIKKDCILAYERDGEPLTAEHGFPVRLVVPGWYGCNSVKWVDRMRVMETMLHDEDDTMDNPERYTHWQQSSYRILPEQDNEPRQHTSIDTLDTEAQMAADEIEQPYMYDMLVKSLITSPVEETTVSPDDGTVTVRGVAWAGDNELQGVEISTDGGEEFADAEFTGPEHGPTAWRLFRFEWEATPGEHTLVSRATDDEGRTQPATVSDLEEGLRGIEDDKYPWNQKGYGVNAYMPEAITVTVSEGS